MLPLHCNTDCECFVHRNYILHSSTMGLGECELWTYQEFSAAMSNRNASLGQKLCRYLREGRTLNDLLLFLQTTVLV